MSCTSIYWEGTRIPASIQLSPNILSISGSNLSEDQKVSLDHNRSQLDKTRSTTVESENMAVYGVDLTPNSNTSSFTLRFFGPSSDRLTLQLTHRSKTPDQLLKVGSLAFELPQSDTFVLEDIIIHNKSTQSSGLTFEPGCRNTLTFTVTSDRGEYLLRDIELLDENGHPYHPTDDGDGEVTLGPRPSRLGESSAYIEEVASQ